MRLVLLAIILSALCVTVYSDEDNSFRVNNISVDASMGSLEDSKSIALDEGMHTALYRLISKLSIPNNKQNIEKCISMNSPSMKNLLEGYEINSERMTSRSYSADVNFIFKKREVNALMSRCISRYSSAQLGQALLIPFIQTSNGYRLVNSDLDSKLFKALDNIDDNTASISLRKITDEDIKDITDLDPEVLISGGYNEVIEEIKNYGANSAIVLVFSKTMDKKISASVRMIASNSVYEEDYNYAANAYEANESFIARSLKDMLERTDANWKSSGLSDDTQKVFISNVTFEVSSRSDWNKIQEILKKVKLVKQYRFRNVSTDEIEIEIKYINSPEALSSRLLQNGVGVFKRDGKTIMKLIEKS